MYAHPLESQHTSCPRAASSMASCCAYPFTPPPLLAPSDTLAQFASTIRIRAEYTGLATPFSEMGIIRKTSMPTITCDRCEKPIEVPNPLMGQRVTCPSCGDVNIIRTLSNSPAPSSDRAAAAGYPPALGPEQDVMIVRPAIFRAKPLRFL